MSLRITSWALNWHWNKFTNTNNYNCTRIVEVNNFDIMASFKLFKEIFFTFYMDLDIKNTCSLFRLCYSIVSCFAIYYACSSHWPVVLISQNHSITRLISIPKKLKNEPNQAQLDANEYRVYPWVIISNMFFLAENTRSLLPLF
jgi:hypothetical protein